MILPTAIAEVQTKVSTTSATGQTRKSAGRWSARPIIGATVLAIGVSLD